MQGTDTAALAAAGKDKQSTSSAAQTAGDARGLGVSAPAADPRSPMHRRGADPDLGAEHPAVLGPDSPEHAHSAPPQPFPDISQ